VQRIRRIYRFFFVRNRSLTAVSVLFVISLIVAFSTGFWLVSRLANLILVGVPVAYVWSRLNVRGLAVTVERPADRNLEGDWRDDDESYGTLD
jgi:hypothetical protein